MATWKFFSCDLKTGQLLAELPLIPSGTISTLLCQDGAGSFTLPLTDPATPDEWWLSIEPYKTTIVCEVNDIIVWSGFIKSWQASAGSSASVEMVCSTMEAYLQERYVDFDLTFASPDQHAVLRGLITHANVSGINLLMDIPDSGVFLETVKYYRYADQQIYEMIREISDSEGGPEWTITSAWDDTGITRKVVHTVHARTPMLGSTASPDYTFTFPGNIKEWSIERGGPYANVVVVGGNGDDVTRLMSTSGIAQDTLGMSYGYPLIESRLSTQLGNQNSVNAAALGELAAKKKMTTILSVTVDINAIDVTNLWGKGDTCLVKIDAPNLLGQYSDVWRIIGWDVDSLSDTITPQLIEYE